MGGVRHGRNSLHCVTNLVVPVPDLIDLCGGQHAVLINPLRQLHDNPGECQAEHHFNGKPIGCAIEIEEQEPVDGFAKSKGSEYHCHPYQAQRQAVDRTKLQRLITPTIFHECYSPAKRISVQSLNCATTFAFCAARKAIMLAWAEAKVSVRIRSRAPPRTCRRSPRMSGRASRRRFPDTHTRRTSLPG